MSGTVVTGWAGQARITVSTSQTCVAVPTNTSDTVAASALGTALTDTLSRTVSTDTFTTMSAYTCTTVSATGILGHTMPAPFVVLSYHRRRRDGTLDLFPFSGLFLSRIQKFLW